jgi:hypothetical protein
MIGRVSGAGTISETSALLSRATLPPIETVVERSTIAALDECSYDHANGVQTVRCQGE